MCTGKAYLETDDTSELLMEDLASVEVEGDTVLFTTLFGDQKTVPGVISKVDFESGEITLCPCNA